MLNGMILSTLVATYTITISNSERGDDEVMHTPGDIVVERTGTCGIAYQCKTKLLTSAKSFLTQDM